MERVEAERKNRTASLNSEPLPYTDIAYNSPLRRHRQRPIYKELKRPPESSVFTFSGAKVRVNFAGLQGVNLVEI
jgi:hypothetical protein